jgi:hypothetical protein
MTAPSVKPQSRQIAPATSNAAMVFIVKPPRLRGGDAPSPAVVRPDASPDARRLLLLIFVSLDLWLDGNSVAQA